MIEPVEECGRGALVPRPASGETTTVSQEVTSSGQQSFARGSRVKGGCAIREAVIGGIVEGAIRATSA